MVLVAFTTNQDRAHGGASFHYHLPKAPVGPCSVKNVLPTKQGWINWWQNDTQVKTVLLQVA